MDKYHQGTILTWEEMQKQSHYVKEQAIKQFVRLFPLVKDRTCSTLTWGDETEYMLIRLNHEEQKAYITCNSQNVLSDVNRLNHNDTGCSDKMGSAWTLELPACMVESSPSRPFGGRAFGFELVQKNIKFRREQINSVLSQGSGDVEDVCLALACFPRYWCHDSAIPSKNLPAPTRIDSLDAWDFITPIPRCRAIEENTVERSGQSPSGYIPIFEDTSTDSSILVSPITGLEITADKPGHLPFTGPSQVAGVAALQITLQCSNLNEARILHDQLVPICPIMMALSASAPICQGYLTDWDSRWNILSACFDYRTSAERGNEKLPNDSFSIPRSPFGSANGYISQHNAIYNDVYFPFENEIFKQLMEANGIDTCLARHIARLFVRDPFHIFEENLHQSENDTDHLYNMLTSNWQSVKLRLPREDDAEAGWRVEFRPMGVQLTDFENAAYLIFMVLLTRAILSLELDFVMPISKVDSNMDKAPERDAVQQQTFAFRAEPHAGAEEKILSEMSIDVIINGGNTAEGSAFPGLIPMIKRYLATIQEHVDGFKPMIEGYLNLISDRAAGRVKTTAQWFRDYVLSHPGYKQDSIVTGKICYDLVKLCRDIQQEKVGPRHLSREFE